MPDCGGGADCVDATCGEGCAGGNCVASGAGGGACTAVPASGDVFMSPLAVLISALVCGGGAAASGALGGGGGAAFSALLISGSGAEAGGGGAATGSVPPRRASPLYFASARSDARDDATCCCWACVDEGAGRSGIAARSGDSPACASASGSGNAVWLLSPPPTQVVGSTQSGMLEQALAPRATMVTTPKRAQIFFTSVMQKPPSPAPTPRVQRNSYTGRAGASKPNWAQIHEIL